MSPEALELRVKALMLVMRPAESKVRVPVMRMPAAEVAARRAPFMVRPSSPGLQVATNSQTFLFAALLALSK